MAGQVSRSIVVVVEIQKYKNFVGKNMVLKYKIIISTVVTYMNFKGEKINSV